MAKRLLDLTVGSVLVLLSLGVVVVMAVVLAIELRAWPFFTQQRVGRDGRAFTLVKMRTLPPETPTDADKYALRSVRVPPVARWLRELHLDELPQLWLVVLGRMSLVGPRPEMPHLVARIPAELAELRHRVRPGCTGLWQVSAVADGLIHEHPEYDRTYVERHSLGLDLWILWQTFLVMLGRPRAVTLEQLPTTVPVADGRPVPVDGLEVRVDGLAVTHAPSTTDIGHTPARPRTPARAAHEPAGAGWRVSSEQA